MDQGFTPEDACHGAGDVPDVVGRAGPDVHRSDCATLGEHDQAVRHVADVGEVTAPWEGPEQVHRFVAPKGRDPGRDRHVGALVLPDDAERTADHDRASHAKASAAQPLDSEFAARVPAERVRPVGLAARSALPGTAVHRGRGSDDERDRRRYEGEHPACRLDVVATTHLLRVRSRIPYPGAARQMEDRVSGAQRVLYLRVLVEQVRGKRVETVAGSGRDPVHADHRVTALYEPIDEVSADEPG